MMVMIAVDDLLMEKIKALSLSSCILTLGFTVTTAVVVNNKQSKSQVSADSSRSNYFVNPEDAFKPYGESREGIITFRGNPTRNYYVGTVALTRRQSLKNLAAQRRWRQERTQSTSPRLSAPPSPDLQPRYPTRTPLRQVLGLGRQTVQRVLQ